jgi:hypothetical protein
VTTSAAQAISTRTSPSTTTAPSASPPCWLTRATAHRCSFF